MRFMKLVSASALLLLLLLNKITHLKPYNFVFIISTLDKNIWKYIIMRIICIKFQQ